MDGATILDIFLPRTPEVRTLPLVSLTLNGLRMEWCVSCYLLVTRHSERRQSESCRSRPYGT